MRTSHAVFLKLTTTTIPTFMTGLNLGATGSNGQSFNKAILWYGDIVQRKHKQEESNEFDPPVHHDCSDCSGLLPDGLDSETHSVSEDRMAAAGQCSNVIFQLCRRRQRTESGLSERQGGLKSFTIIVVRNPNGSGPKIAD
jgi:hypothetical protein